MAFILSDIYIGNFPITQSFGARPEVYSARYNLKGHNGIDIGCPSLTLILATAGGVVLETGFDSGGYGNYIKILHDGFLSLYGHLHDIVVKKGDHVIVGQLIGHSNNTGFSDAPHLHFGVALCDSSGNKTNPNNGYSGYDDPMGNLFQWSISNLSAPAVQTVEVKEPVKVNPDDFTAMVSEGSSYKVIASYLLSKGLNDFLSANGRQPVDINTRPVNPEDGNSCVFYLQALFQETQTLQNEKTELQIALQNQNQQVVPSSTTTVTQTASTQDVQKLLNSVTSNATSGFLITQLNKLKAFIFV